MYVFFQFKIFSVVLVFFLLNELHISFLDFLTTQRETTFKFQSSIYPCHVSTKTIIRT